MAYHFDGRAIFSTRNGEFARREKIPSIRTILRSNPIEDQQTMVAKLQKDFPEACRAITTPVKDRDVYEYFDYCDAAVQGFEFLRAVLEYIAGLNASVNAKKATEVQDYVSRWKNTNSESFSYMRPYHAVTDLFTKEDIEEYGVEFLTEAMMKIKQLRVQADDDRMVIFLVNEAHTLMVTFAEARQSALRLQMQHAQMMHNQRNFTQLQAPARPPFPINLSAAPGMRASSNPEHGQPQPQGGLLRQLPGPPGQFPVPQSRIPLQRLTPSTEALEHIHPGSTSRGDFHSDPTANNAMDTYNFGPPNNYVAIPSRGLPGPFTYRPPPPPTQPVPQSNRVGTFDGNLPKGKKNPKKKSSDDARMVSNPGDGPHQASNGANPKRPFAPQNIQIPTYPRSADTIPSIQEVRPSSGAVPYSGNYHQSNLPPSHHLGNGRETANHPPYHGQGQMQPVIEGRSRAVSNPHSPSGRELQGLTQDPRPPIPNLAIPTNGQHRGAAAKGQSFEENAGFVSTHVRPHISRPLDPHAFGHQLPDRQTDAQDRQDPIPDYQRPALAPRSNAGQPPCPGTPGRQTANESLRRPTQEGCTIWIGGLPNDFDKAAVMHLLRPCRGLLDVSVPKVSPTKSHVNRSYAFASFQNPIDAAEALERLPQTRFASLPEGTFLIANYPKPRLHPSPGHYQYGGDGDSKRPASNVSPTKSRNGGDSDRAGKPKNEHGRKPSKGSARGNQGSTGSSVGKLGEPSERVTAVDTSENKSDLQFEEATAIPDPHDKAGSVTRESQSSRDGREDSRPTNQDHAFVQPEVGVETHANQVPRNTGDGAHQATNPRHVDGRAKAPKKKSKGSNKLPAPQNTELKPPTLQLDSEISKPPGPARPPAIHAAKIVKVSGDLEDKGQQGGREIEASKATASTVPLEPTFTLPKDSETPDQSFLGCNPKEDDGEKPKASVADVIKPSGTKDGEVESETAPALGGSAVPAVPLEQLKEPTSKAMRRDVSNSTQGSTDTTQSMSSSMAPPSSSQTERSNSITQERLSPMIQTACLSSEAALFSVFLEPGETAMGQEPEITTSLALSETTCVEEQFKPAVNGEFGGFQPGPIEENPEQTPSMLLMQPSPSKSDRALLRSPARSRAPSIPPRSSSLAAPSTPIKTHQKKKKKPQNFTPVKQAPSEDDMCSPSKVIGLAIKGTKLDSSVQTTESTKLKFSVLTIDPAAHTRTTDKSKDLPKPETPFLMDDGVRVAPPKISRQIEMEATNADQYYAQKDNYRAFHLGNAMQINAAFNTLDCSDSTSTRSSETSTSDLETTLREAGFRSLSGTSPFTIKDPGLAILELIDEGGNPLENRTHKDGPVLSWIDDKGKIGPGMSFSAWTKQHEMIEVVKKATAVKRLLASSPPLPWTRIESLRQQLLRSITQFFSDAQEQQTTKAKAQKILRANALLDTIPQRDSSTSEMEKWARNASLFMEENFSEPLPAHAQSRKPTANSLSKSSRGTLSRKHQQERRHPVLINQPEPQTLACKLGKDEDTFQTAHIELNNPLTSGQSTESEPSPSTLGRRTPSEEPPALSVSVMPSAPLNQENKLKDLCVEMGKDRRRWSDDRQRISSPQKEERMTISDPELKRSDGEFDVRRVTDVRDGEPEPGVKETENEVQLKPHENKQSENKGKKLGSENRKQDQSEPAKSDETKGPAPAESKESSPEKPEDHTHQKQTSQPLGVSFSSFGSNYATSNEGDSEETQHHRRRGGHSPLKRSGYNAVAGRGIDGKRGGMKEGSKDPWALPQGEKPWGEGRGGEKKRGRQ